MHRVAESDQDELKAVLLQLLETSERIAIYKFADGTLSIPGRRFREAQNEARRALGLPERPIRNGVLFTHSGTGELKQ